MVPSRPVPTHSTCRRVSSGGRAYEPSELVVERGALENGRVVECAGVGHQGRRLVASGRVDLVGTEVSIVENSPRISTGENGFGS